MQPISVTFLASGNGGSLKFIHQAARQLGLPLTVGHVIADRDCGALDYARQHGLPATRLNYTRKSPEALQASLQAVPADVVVTNIHKIIDANTLNLLPWRFINLHYSLLPAFKGFIGMETVEQARSLNTTIIGATCHEVDEEVDNGKALAQFAVGIDWERDTTSTVYDLVFRGASLVLLQGILQKLGMAGAPVPAPIYYDKPLLFAPTLSFAAAKLDEAFWQRLKDVPAAG